MYSCTRTSCGCMTSCQLQDSDSSNAPDGVLTCIGSNYHSILPAWAGAAIVGLPYTAGCNIQQTHPASTYKHQEDIAFVGSQCARYMQGKSCLSTALCCVSGTYRLYCKHHVMQGKSPCCGNKEIDFLGAPTAQGCWHARTRMSDSILSVCLHWD